MMKTIAGISAGLCLWAGLAAAQDQHGAQGRDALDRMRDRDLQPERVMDVIGLRPGMAVGEAGASYGYFTFKLSVRVGSAGTVYANDITPDALRTIERRAASERTGNIKTVLGEETDPRFPRNDLDMVIVFDCLFEFSKPAEWMTNARRCLKPGGRLVIVDPDRSKMSSVHFLSRQQVHDLARESGYTVVTVDDAFLENHMIVVLQFERLAPAPPSLDSSYRRDTVVRRGAPDRRRRDGRRVLVRRIPPCLGPFMMIA